MAAAEKQRETFWLGRHRPRPESDGQAENLQLNAGARLILVGLVGFFHLLSLLPDGLLYGFGVLGGWVGYLMDRRHVKIGLSNLAIALPERSERERRRILRASYVNLGRSAAEYVRLAGFGRQRLCRRVSYERFGYWEELKERYPGRGIIVLSAHFGNFELLPAAHAMHGFPISLVHHRQRFRPGQALITYVRSRCGVTLIRQHGGGREVWRRLRSGELVGIALDQNTKRSEAVFVPFFGEPAATTGGVARLAQLSGALVVPVFIVRQSDGRSHRIQIFDHVPLAATGDPEADTRENTARFLQAIEAIVRRYPEQFLWTHRRYRTRLPGMPQVYGQDTDPRRKRKRNRLAATAASAGPPAQVPHQGNEQQNFCPGGRPA